MCQTLCQSKDTTHSSSKEDRQILTGYKGQRFDYETKNSQMQTMGMDACMMIGYHNKVSKIVANQSFYSKLENYDHLTYHVF